MAMGRRKQVQQQPLFIVAAELPKTPAHPFYQKLNQILADGGFDPFVEGLCAPFYHRQMPPLLPYVPQPFVEGLCAPFFLVGHVGAAILHLGDLRIRIVGVVPVLVAGLVLALPVDPRQVLPRGRFDARGLGQTLEEFIIALARVVADDRAHGRVGLQGGGVEADGLAANQLLPGQESEDPAEDGLVGLQVDQAAGAGDGGVVGGGLVQGVAGEGPQRQRVGAAPGDAAFGVDALEVAQQQQAEVLAGRQRRPAHGLVVEHAVDMESGAVLAVTIQPADEGDTSTWRPTVEETYQNLNAVREDEQAAANLHENPVEELVQDKGYHSNQTMLDYQELEIRSYVSEPDRGRRDWEGKTAERDAVYANRRRIRGKRGKQLMRKRGELIERSFAHTLETGGMRRTHLRGHENILKRVLVHVGGFNLGLVMRKLIGVGKPRRLQGAFSRIFGLLGRLWSLLAGFGSNPEASACRISVWPAPRLVA